MRQQDLSVLHARRMILGCFWLRLRVLSGLETENEIPLAECRWSLRGRRNVGLCGMKGDMGRPLDCRVFAVPPWDGSKRTLNGVFKFES
jgi:hypothetical protein